MTQMYPILSSALVNPDNYISYHICSKRLELETNYVRAAFLISLIGVGILASCSHYIAISGSPIAHWIYVGGAIVLTLIAVEAGRILNHKFKWLYHENAES